MLPRFKSGWGLPDGTVIARGGAQLSIVSNKFKIRTAKSYFDNKYVATIYCTINLTDFTTAKLDETASSEISTMRRARAAHACTCLS